MHVLQSQDVLHSVIIERFYPLPEFSICSTLIFNFVLLIYYTSTYARVNLIFLLLGVEKFSTRHIRLILNNFTVFLQPSRVIALFYFLLNCSRRNRRKGMI